MKAHGEKFEETGAFTLYRNAIPEEDAERLFRAILEGGQIPWKQEKFTMQGVQMDVPRLTSWHGVPHESQGQGPTPKIDPNPWTAELEEIRSLAQEHAESHFNSVLLNLYRGARDSPSFHGDNADGADSTNSTKSKNGANGANEEEPVIALVSLGQKRRFRVQPKKGSGNRMSPFVIMIESGSILVMKGRSQADWEHSIPKAKNQAIGPMVNLVFRQDRQAR